MGRGTLHDEGCYGPEGCTNLCDASKLAAALGDLEGELDRAFANWDALNSAHEGYAVILEEFQELWEHVCMKQTRRDLVAMRAEAIQVAAMAVRFAVEVCDERRGRK